MLRFLFDSILDILMPPRKSAAVVQTLTEASLAAIAQDGSLPYRHPAVRALVWELKYRANAHALLLAAALLSEELLAIGEEELGAPLLIPAPMHAGRRKERGYNQTELLCQAALSYMKGASEGFIYEPRALVRVRASLPQQGLPRRLRLRNVKGSMRAVHPERIEGRSCIVMDDVSTTGATLAEAKRALKEAGAKRVHLLALARS